MIWILLCACGALATTGGGRARRQAFRAYVGLEASTPGRPPPRLRLLLLAPYPWAIVWGPTEEGSAEGGAARRTEGAAGDPRTPAGGGPGLRDGEAGLQEEVEEEEGTEGPYVLESLPKGTDPQLYVTITVSALIVLSALGILLKFGWEHRQRRTRSRGVVTEESRQVLTGRWAAGGGAGPGGFGEIRGLWAASAADRPSELGEGLEVRPTRYKSNRIPLVDL